MYVTPVGLGSGTDWSWISSTPSARKSNKSKTVNPFNPDGKSPNPLRDIVTLSGQGARVVRETSEFSPMFNNLFLMYPNDKIREFAFEIVGVREDDRNDLKMKKIARWVQQNITYLTDKENYGVPEFWAPPVFTLAKQSGDCEDGAFLMASLALNSGIPSNRIRMYGGFVNSGPGALSGGHGWVGYQRESDDEWVAVDYSYHPNPDIDSLLPMSEDMKYVDDYFFMMVNEMIQTPGTNRVRDPEGYNSMAQLQYSVLVGNLIDTFI